MGWWEAIPMSMSAMSSIMGMGAGDKASAEAEKYVKEGRTLGQERIDLGQWFLDDWKQNGMRFRDQLAEDAFGPGQTSAFEEEAGVFGRGMATAGEKVRENQELGADLQTSMLSGLDVAKAKGMAELRIKDNQRKDALKGTVLSASYQTPGAAQLLSGAMGDQQDYFSRLAGSYNDQAMQAYQGAGQAMGQLSSSFMGMFNTAAPQKPGAAAPPADKPKILDKIPGVDY